MKYELIIPLFYPSSLSGVLIVSLILGHVALVVFATISWGYRFIKDHVPFL